MIQSCAVHMDEEGDIGLWSDERWCLKACVVMGSAGVWRCGGVVC